MGVWGQSDGDAHENRDATHGAKVVWYKPFRAALPVITLRQSKRTPIPNDGRINSRAFGGCHVESAAANASKATHGGYTSAWAVAFRRIAAKCMAVARDCPVVAILSHVLDVCLCDQTRTMVLETPRIASPGPVGRYRVSLPPYFRTVDVGSPLRRDTWPTYDLTGAAGLAVDGQLRDKVDDVASRLQTFMSSSEEGRLRDRVTSHLPCHAICRPMWSR